MRWIALLLMLLLGIAQANDWDVFSEACAIAIMRWCPAQVIWET